MFSESEFLGVLDFPLILVVTPIIKSYIIKRLVI